MRSLYKSLLCPIATGTVLLVACLPLWAGIYTWTDEKGVRHYSNVAPSETESEIQQQDEIPSSTPDRNEPTEPIGTGVTEPAASGNRTPAEDSTPVKPDTEEKRTGQAGAESAPEAAASPTKVPTEQNEIVQSEKAAVRQLQRQLGQDATRRSEFVEKERQRLTRALEQLQKTPVSEFGSQKNKTRAMGYYRYRLEALQESPEGYFQYGDSDID